MLLAARTKLHNPGAGRSRVNASVSPKLAPAAPAAASLLHLEGPVPPEIGLHPDGLAPCPSPAHCERQDWTLPDPVAALAEPCARVLLPTSASGPMTQAGARPLARITGLSLGSGKSLDLTLWAAP